MFRAVASLMLFGALSPLGAFRPESALSVPQVSPLPPISSFFVGQNFSASGAIVVDVLSGRELFAHAAGERRPIGSLAKLMTALVIIENHELDEIVTIPQSVSMIGGNVVRLQSGERYTIRDMLTALLIGSGNDAAYSLALFHSGSIEEFALAMNERSAALGLSNTHFTNPIGFDSPHQYSTPRELAWIALFALKNDLISDLTSKKQATIRDQSGEHTIVIHNTNRLLSSHPSRFFGLKTGTTDAAGQCLIALTYEEGRPYIFVVLKSADRYADTLQLLQLLSEAHV